MSQRDEDRVGEEEIDGTRLEVMRVTAYQKLDFRQIERKNRNFRVLGKTASEKKWGIPEFRISDFVEGEFVDLGSYVSSFDTGELFLKGKSKGKIQLPVVPFWSLSRGGGKTRALKLTEEFEKEKKECLEILNRLAEMIQRLKNEKEKTA